MMPMNLAKRRGLRILALGAHSDDLEIGCGGTILRFLEEFPGTRVTWVVFGAGNPQRAAEAEKSAKAFLRSGRPHHVIVRGFRDGFFPYVGGDLKDAFEDLKKKISPDLILTHYRNDLHQDHRMVCELTWNTWRGHLIWEYEIPKYDGDLGTPNMYVSISPEICRRKISYLMKFFDTQRSKRWFTPDLFQGLMRIRGTEADGPHPYAEAFYARKVLV